jgi:beta-mannosidase
MVVWQLNDDWPVVSWALVDHAGIRKPVWYAVRQAYQPVLVTVQPGTSASAALDVVVVNASGAAVEGQVEVARTSFDGTVLASGSFPVAVGTADAARVALPASLAVPWDPAAEMLVVTGPLGRTVHDFAEVVDQALEPTPFTTAVEPTADGARVTVTATSYARDVSLFPDRVDPAARVDDGLVSLLPGETVTFTVTDAPGIDTAALTSREVLRHAGSLLH